MRRALLALALVAMAAPAGAEKLASTVSSSTISITSSFDGAVVSLFGTIESDVHGIAAQGRLALSAAAGIKVTAARLGEEVIGECMHIFGGAGYLVDETPLGRVWRDMKLARVGGGTDEVLWELVAAGMKADQAGYEDWVGGSNA